MAQRPQILIDTDILIKIYRGNKEKRKHLSQIQNNLAISIITAIELMAGAKTKKRQFEVAKTVKAFFLYELTLNISITAFNLVKKYGIFHSLKIADALIAAIAIENNFSLYTDNVADYNFIKELKLYQP